MIPTPKTPASSEEETRYRGVALQQLAILRQQMKLGGLVQGKRSVPLGNGVVVECRICFNDESVEVHVPIVQPDAVPIDVLGNFLCHPRSGQVVMRVFFDGQTTREYMVIDHTGFAGDDSTLPGEAAAYPLQDSDHGTFAITISSGRSLVSHSRHEAYGNIDWAGLLKNGKPTQLLSWQGPPSRYFPEITQPEGIHLGRNIYQHGEIIGILPMTGRYTALMDEIPYYVLGAAVASDNNGALWQVVVAREYAIENLDLSVVVHAAMAVFVRRHGSRDNNMQSADHPSGWSKIYDDYQINNGTTLTVPVFFNDTGTEARTIMGRNECRIGVDVNGMTASMSVLPVSLTGDKVYSGATPVSETSGDIYVPTNYVPGTYSSKNGEEGQITDQSKRSIAVDWRDGSFVYAVISWSVAASGFTGGSSTMTVSEMSVYGSRTYSSYAESGSDGSHLASCELLFNGMSVPLCAHSRQFYSKSVTDIQNNFGWNINDGPPPGTHWFVDEKLAGSSEWQLSAILYLDLRHNICLLNEVGLSTTYEQYNNVVYKVDGEPVK